jgi:hypothetical protein
MGYQRIDRDQPCPITTTVQVRAQQCNLNKTPLSAAYENAIQRRLAGLVVSFIRADLI